MHNFFILIQFKNSTVLNIPGCIVWKKSPVFRELKLHKGVALIIQFFVESLDDMLVKVRFEFYEAVLQIESNYIVVFQQIWLAFLREKVWLEWDWHPITRLLFNFDRFLFLRLWSPFIMPI
jgi:hypothetical protein